MYVGWMVVWWTWMPGIMFLTNQGRAHKNPVFKAWMPNIMFLTNQERAHRNPAL